MVNFYIYYNTHTHTHTHTHIYIYIYLFINIKNNNKLKIVNGIDRYKNISFHWSNQYNLQYEIDSLGI